MDHCLRELGASALNPSTHMGAHSHLQLQFDLILSSVLRSPCIYIVHGH